MNENKRYFVLMFRNNILLLKTVNDVRRSGHRSDVPYSLELIKLTAASRKEYKVVPFWLKKN